MKRKGGLKKIRRGKTWDIVIIGGGATGLGIALDAASRGFKVLLLEKYDFAKGTSSRSTKLVHGGVRYLQQGDVSLVFEALKERGLMFQNAPHLVRNLSFVIPSYEWWASPFYTIGLKVYDMMAGKLGMGKSEMLSRDEIMKELPNVEREGLKGGVIYHDGQFDDARMAISLALTADHYGATLLNYVEVTGLIKKDELIAGVEASDVETGERFTIPSKVVINATGVFSDSILQMETADAKPIIQPSQGVHLVIDKSFLPGEHAIMVPHTGDGRVLFAVPWYNRVILGTTDTLVENPSPEPRALEEEIEFIMKTIKRYLAKEPTREDVLSVFAGLRPLAATQDGSKNTKEISRHHKVMVSATGLCSVIGGKWTTYRKMAEDAVDHAILIGGLPERKCITRSLFIHGYSSNTLPGSDPLSAYGSYRERVEELEEESDDFKGYLSEKLGLLKSQVIWAARHEQARTVEDILARRTRALFLDARESIAIAPTTAKLMATELDLDKKWERQQVKAFTEVAEGYLI